MPLPFEEWWKGHIVLPLSVRPSAPPPPTSASGVSNLQLSFFKRAHPCPLATFLVNFVLMFGASLKCEDWIIVKVDRKHQHFYGWLFQGGVSAAVPLFHLSIFIYLFIHLFIYVYVLFSLGCSFLYLVFSLYPYLVLWGSCFLWFWSFLGATVSILLAV